MTLKSYLWGMRLGTFISLAALFLVVCYNDPEKEGTPLKFAFYFTLFLFLSGFFILTLSGIRRKFGKDKTAFSDLGTSFREGMLLALLSVAFLILQSFRFLTWWDGLLVIAGIFLIELYFLTK